MARHLNVRDGPGEKLLLRLTFSPHVSCEWNTFTRSVTWNRWKGETIVLYNAKGVCSARPLYVYFSFSARLLGTVDRRQTFLKSSRPARPTRNHCWRFSCNAMAYFSERMNPKINISTWVWGLYMIGILRWPHWKKEKKSISKTELLFSLFKASYLTSILLIYYNLFLELY